jgi:ribosomal protein L39E
LVFAKTAKSCVKILDFHKIDATDGDELVEQTFLVLLFMAETSITYIKASKENRNIPRFGTHRFLKLCEKNTARRHLFRQKLAKNHRNL